MLAFTLFECLEQAKWIWFSKKRLVNDIDLIDGESRWLLENFKILTQSVVRSFISISVITIILSIVIDSFVQLTVGKKNALKYDKSSKAQIACAQRYDKRSFETNDNMSKKLLYSLKISLLIETPSWWPFAVPVYSAGLEGLLALIDADMGMKSAVTYDLSQSDSLFSQQIQHSCSSGNCTWDKFMSATIFQIKSKSEKRFLCTVQRQID